MSPRSLQVRLALMLGAGVTLLWLGAAAVTAHFLRNELDEVFDSALEETAQRLLPLAVMDILGRDDEGVSQRVAALRTHEEFYTYLVRDAEGQVLIASHHADPAEFPPCAVTGFNKTRTQRLYCDSALRGSVTITVAEPMSHRAAMLRELGWVLGLPLLVVIPLALGGIVLVVRRSFAPVRRLRDSLALRGARDLSELDATGLPDEIAPVAAAVNQLLARLHGAFEAERSFAANAAHELRTPIAGASAQAQRIRIETADPQAARRAGEIETTLKRLSGLAEKLLQMARAEGGRVTGRAHTELAPILRLVAADFIRSGAEGRIRLELPDRAVTSTIDPDAFAILCRNLIENALRHGAADQPVEAALTPEGCLRVRNGGGVVAPEVLSGLTRRFERAPGAGEGAGLGLSIVHTIAERAGGILLLSSPVPGRVDGFEALVRLPA